MNTFIRVVEVWVPDATGSLLEFGGGLYGSAHRFGGLGRNMCFGRGEGLPGQAWERGRPIVLKPLAGGYFRRGQAAAAEGLSCAIALPFFVATRLTAVLLILCGEGAGQVAEPAGEQAGAIDLWHNDPGASTDMVLDDGYYGSTAEVFESISRQTSFRRGIGLPGLAWESGLPVFLPDLGKGTRFLRSDCTVKVGINRGFAIPCTSVGRGHYVLAFLSALATPLVRRFETWVPDTTGAQLQRSEGFCETANSLGAGAGHIARGEGTLGRAWASAVPVVSERAADEPREAGAAARAAGLASLVALPVLRGGEVVAVVAWYF
ncbi:MAG: GAF domain-containing protein [Leptothrix sp. (in: Bacteria)]|nr:GAF domain-containing protein [Leptothrix sp. (in: b-proteobacteria)]